MKKYFMFILLLFVGLIMPINMVNALTYVDSADKVHDIDEYKKYQFVVDSYNVVVNVTKDNIYEVTEKIDVYYFNHSNVYGIKRFIPNVNYIHTFDGELKKQNVKIYDVKVQDTEFKTINSGSNFVISVGTPGNRVVEEHSYVISYKYDPGKDTTEYYDEFYFEVIPYSFDTAIGAATFTINFPKEIDTQYLRVSALDHNYDTSNGELVFEVKDNKTIIGHYGGILKHNQGISVRAELTDCYFETKNIDFQTWNYLIYLVPVFLVVVSFIIWYLYGREDVGTMEPQFYPPAGFNSLEIGFLFRTFATEKDVISLLLYLANMGYISIMETEDKDQDNKTNGFIVIKEKEYDGFDEMEKKFLDGLFSDGKNQVSNKELSDRFYLITDSIREEINRNTASIIEKSTWIKRILMGVFVLITFAIITIYPMLAYHEESKIAWALISTTIGFSAMFIMTFGSFKMSQNFQNEFGGQVIFRLSGLFIGLILGILPFFKNVYVCLVDQPLFMFGYIVGLISVFIICMFISYMSLRTTYGEDIYNKIRGLRLFMLMGNSNTVDKLLEENDNYCYDLLPYAYVLGITDMWISKFTDKNVLKPFWYVTRDRFKVREFGEYVERIMDTAEKSMVNRTEQMMRSREGKNRAL